MDAGCVAGARIPSEVDRGDPGQYDGALHLAGDVRRSDVAKEAAYRDLGLEGVTMMAGDLADRAPFERRLREAYARAARKPAADRARSLQTPAWTYATSSGVGVRGGRPGPPSSRCRRPGRRPGR